MASVGAYPAYVIAHSHDLETTRAHSCTPRVRVIVVHVGNPPSQADVRVATGSVPILISAWVVCNRGSVRGFVAEEWRQRYDG